jgi:hypothetical protein
VAILVFAATIRLAGIRFGLPAEFRPDEDYVANRALGILAGQYDVNFFFWPSFYFYAVAPFYAAMALVRHVFLDGPGRGHIITDAVLNPEPWILSIRVLGAMFGTLMVVWVWRLARRIVGIPCGLVAAAIAATAFLSVRESHFGLQDAPAAAVIALGLLLAVRAHEEQRLILWAGAGAAAGIAAALKYHPGLVIAPIAILALTRGWKPLALVGLTSAVTLVVCSPMLFLRPADVINALQQQFLTVGSESEHLFPSLRWYLDPVLTAGVGIPVMVLACLGIARAVWRRDIVVLALAVHCAVTLLFFGHEHTSYFRYLLPILPSLAVLAAYGAAGITAGNRLAIGAAAALAVALPFHHDVAFDRLLLRIDTREIAFRWMEKNLPRDARIATTYFGGVSHDQNLVEHNNSTGFGPAKGLIQNRLAPYPVYLLQDNDPLASAARIPPGHVDFVVLSSQYPQQRLPAVPPGKEILFRISPLSPDANPVYDGNDGFYVPIKDFRGVSRPGPEVVIYRQ